MAAIISIALIFVAFAAIFALLAWAINFFSNRKHDGGIRTEYLQNGSVTDLEAFLLNAENLLKKGKGFSVKLAESPNFDDPVSLGLFLQNLSVVFDGGKLTLILVTDESIVMLAEYAKAKYTISVNISQIRGKDGKFRYANKLYKIPSSKGMTKMIKDVEKYIIGNQVKIVSEVGNNVKPTLIEQCLKKSIITGGEEIPQKDRVPFYYELVSTPTMGYVLSKKHLATLESETQGDIDIYYPRVEVGYKTIKKTLKGSQLMGIMELAAGNINMFISGDKGSGKTRLVKRLVYNLCAKNDPDVDIILMTSQTFGNMLEDVEQESVLSPYTSGEKKAIIILDDLLPMPSMAFTRALTSRLDGVNSGSLKFVLVSNTIAGKLEDVPEDFYRPGRIDLFIHIVGIDESNINEIISEVIAKTPDDPRQVLNTTRLKELSSGKTIQLGDVFSCLEEERIINIFNEDNLKKHLESMKDVTGVAPPFKLNIKKP